MAKRRKSQLSSIDEINMTPLIDLTFTLLIIFMITTPLMENAVNVRPPKMDATPFQTDEKNSRSINIDNNGQISFDKVPMSQEQLLEELRILYAQQPETVIFLRADEGRRYKEVIELMGAIRKAGFESVNLVTTATDNGQ